MYNDWGKQSTSISFVFGGKEVDKLGLYPWHVAVFLSNKYLGGGSIISERFVLTATHMITEVTSNVAVDPKRLTIKTGIVKLSSDSSKGYGVVEIFRYPGYNSTTYKNDICLLKLETKLRFDNNVRPIFLWDSHDVSIEKLIEQKKHPIVVGFGYTEAQLQSDTLQHATMNFVTNEACLKQQSSFKDSLSDDQNFCIHHPQKSACQGGSGGSVFVQQKRNGAQVYYLRGLVTGGASSCAQDSMVTITDVAYYAKWIEKIALPWNYNLIGHPECPNIETDKANRISMPGVVSLRYAFRKQLFTLTVTEF
ncbi:trypsin-4-like isoform X2 [Wyeomyia smithii]|uniref:trypsin-4-like isoform X2 n=1 Tax=Wyeomyia smithii TaxID=174621 RepID=UPI002467D77A|nr:trypsin-4-like isoform X2 [Wyeomyia smithii]